MTNEPHTPLAEDEVVESEIDIERVRRTSKGVLGVAILFVIGIAATLTVVYWPEAKEQVTEIPSSVGANAISTERSAPRVPFTDVTEKWGIDFLHVNGAEGEKLLPETMGSGAIFFDYDNDLDPDLLLVNSQKWESPKNPQPSTHHFYRNDGDRFTDVTRDVGLAYSSYGMGGAAADVNGDGYLDLVITNLRANQLFLNRDGKRFEEVPQGLGPDELWSTSAAFLDYDRDGDLDLFIANYVTWSRQTDLDQGFEYLGLGRGYGPPTNFAGTQCQLFQNDGSGKFTDVSEESGVVVRNRATGVLVAKSLGVCPCDWNQDGWMDLFVANDTVPNFVFLNEQGKFVEIGEELAVARDNNGRARGAMGIDAAYYRNNSQLAMAIGNFANEETALYVCKNPNNPFFNDMANAAGIGAHTRNSLTFGLIFLDYDLDGFVDLATANGHVEPEINLVQASQQHAQPPELFWNAGPNSRPQFVKVRAAESGDAYFEPIVGRGLASADIDGDGDLDILVTANGGRARLLLNGQSSNNTLRLDLLAKSGMRYAHGARAEVESDAGTQVRVVTTGRTYLSQCELTLTFGLGQQTQSGPITITWPDGNVTRHAGLPAGSHQIRAE